MIASQPATRATRPLITFSMFYVRDYCHECGNVHNLELVQGGRKMICHGETFFEDAERTGTHYTRRSGSIRELVPMTPAAKQIALTLDWQIAQETNEPQYIDADQDW